MDFLTMWTKVSMAAVFHYLYRELRHFSRWLSNIVREIRVGESVEIILFDARACCGGRSEVRRAVWKYRQVKRMQQRGGRGGK